MFKTIENPEPWEDMKQIKVRLKDEEDFSETPWAKQDSKGRVFLDNHAILLAPFPTAGMMLPEQIRIEQEGDKMCYHIDKSIETIEITFHPEMFEQIKSEFFDEQGKLVKGTYM